MTRYEIPCVVLQKSSMFGRHTLMPVRIGERTMDGLGHGKTEQRHEDFKPGTKNRSWRV